MKKCSITDMGMRVIQVCAILYWYYILSKTNAIPEAYLLVAAAGLACSVWRWNRKPEKGNQKESVLGMLCSGILSFAVILANYTLFPLDYNGILGTTVKLCSFAGMFFGGYWAFHGIFCWICWKEHNISRVKRKNEKWDWLVLLGAWGCIWGVYLFFLYGVFYPGLGSVDSANQLEQIFSGNYSNHHPFYHTQIIRLCLEANQNINKGVEIYSLLSSGWLSFSFAYVVYTAYQYTGRKAVCAGILLWYAFTPFHIMYSVTMWKDIPFAAAVTLFITMVFRYLKRIGKYKWVNFVLCGLSAAGVCLLRSNGFLAMLAAWVVLLFLTRKENFRLSVMLAAVLSVCFILKYPVLNAIGVEQPDPVESLSIPLQQISRAVADGAELTAEERELLEQVVDVDKLSETYAMWISDFTKNLVRERGNQAYYTEHKMEFLKLYVRLGLRYPLSYIYGWVEQTKGYWNGGYEYWRWVTEDIDFIRDNQFGLTRKVGNGLAVWLISFGVRILKMPIIRIFLCIGVYTWMIVLCMYAAYVRRDRRAWFTAVLPAMIIGTLLVATPVFAEFRYAYGVIASMPMVATACFYPEKE